MGFPIKYFSINLDQHTPYPGYRNSSMPDMNGGQANILWPAPHMVCEFRGTVMTEQFNTQVSNSVQPNNYKQRSTVMFKHTLVRSSTPPLSTGLSGASDEFVWDFQVLETTSAFSAPFGTLPVYNVLDSYSNAANYVSYNASTNEWEFHLDMYGSSVSTRCRPFVTGTYLLI